MNTNPTSADFRALREALGLTVGATSNLLSVNRRTIQRWEHGHAQVPPSAYAELKASGEIDVNVLDSLIQDRQKEIDTLEALMYEVVIESEAYDEINE